MMDGVETTQPNKTLSGILSEIIFVRALAFGDILPD